MTPAAFNLISAAFATMAAVFWAISAAVPVPQIASTQAAIAAGTGVNMHQMNNDSHQLARALQKQSKFSKWGAASAAVAAMVQAASVFF
jgi:hypothetical protein